LDRSSKNLIEIKSRTDNLAATRINKQTAENLIKKSLESQQAVSNQFSSTFDDHLEKINALKQHMTDIKKNATIYENEILKIKRQLKSLEDGAPNKTSKISPSTPTTSAESGDLIQQNLKE